MFADGLKAVSDWLRTGERIIYCGLWGTTLPPPKAASRCGGSVRERQFDI